MKGKENSVRSLRGLGKGENAHGRFLFALKPFRRPGQGGRALGSSVALWICFRKCSRRRVCVRMLGCEDEEPSQSWAVPAAHTCLLPRSFQQQNQDLLGWETAPRWWSPAVRAAQDAVLGAQECLIAIEVMLTLGVLQMKPACFTWKAPLKEKKKSNKLLLTLIFVWMLTLSFQQGLLQFAVQHNLKSWLKMCLRRVRWKQSCLFNAEIKLLFPLVCLGGSVSLPEHSTFRWCACLILQG